MLIDRLLDDREAYADHWLTFWNDLLRNDYKGTGYTDGGRKQITFWLYQSLLANKPYDEFVHELISPPLGSDAEGFSFGIKWRGRVNASQVREIQFSQNVSQVFFGINMKCASCHDSFIDRWKLDDAYALAAVIADEPLEIHRCDKATGKMAVARFLWPELGSIDPTADKARRLEQLADLVTHKENGRFQRTIVNRIWQRLMGRGIVHPVDVMANRPWSEDLLDYLAVYLTDHHYDLKQLISHIVSSQTYQSQHVILDEERSGDAYVFRGPEVKRMTAEQFIDAVWSITDTRPAKVNAPLDAPPPPPVPQREKGCCRQSCENCRCREAKAGSQTPATPTHEVRACAGLCRPVDALARPAESRAGGNDAWRSADDAPGLGPVQRRHPGRHARTRRRQPAQGQTAANRRAIHRFALSPRIVAYADQRRTRDRRRDSRPAADRR